MCDEEESAHKITSWNLEPFSSKIYSTRTAEVNQLSTPSDDQKIMLCEYEYEVISLLRFEESQQKKKSDDTSL